MAVRTRYSIEDYIALEGEYPDRKFKPDSTGAPVEMSPDKIHSFVQSEILFQLKLWLRNSGLPDYNAGAELMHRLEEWICQPDVALVRSEAEDYPLAAPLLAVEVRSQSNTWREMRAKAARYLEYGSAMVWLVDPRRQTLELHLSDAAPQMLSGDDVIEGGATLPGFRVTVSKLFPE
ncbi:MAG: Uma2 family endonuclease [Anaerolineaceae bacterium]|nr:Uma2 family endonuclease [Anaerolineaceae bacterium]MDE0327905.1 Uma2 family endonuclease [Anaerolineaceae bacterium]